MIRTDSAQMEETSVVIIGGGPSGLTLGLALAKYQIPSMIIEKEREITQDPRGVYLNGDAVRIMWDLGLREQFEDVGHVPHSVHFHKTTFRAPPFYSIDVRSDSLQQVVPKGIFHRQPKLEGALEDLVRDSGYCTLRRGCTADSQDFDGDAVVIGYTDETGTSRSVKGNWLVGSDGKKGIVRKNFLEESAGIKQGKGVWEYEGTWIAGNLQLDLPTPKTHPDFPLWKLGFSPDQVYDLYWPDGWHFCSPPGKPTATGRFGPLKDRLWRHEFAEPHCDEPTDTEGLFWEHLGPMITRDADLAGNKFPSGAVQYPRDCINVWRCRPFTFSHKVVNKWFDRRRILIGDAAHVFPPFGGQGIATGIRDAHQLAWRLALIERNPEMNSTTMEKLLTEWATERRQSVNDVTVDTKRNGDLTNESEPWLFFIFRHIEPLYNKIPFLPKPAELETKHEAQGFKGRLDGFFLSKFNGGGRIAQVFLENREGRTFLSDEILRLHKSVMTVLVIEDDEQQSNAAQAQKVIRQAQLPCGLLAEDSMVVIQEKSNRHWREQNPVTDAVFRTTRQGSTHGLTAPLGYSPGPYIERLGASTKFAIVRPDYYIFALLRSAVELERALVSLRGTVEQRHGALRI